MIAVRDRITEFGDTEVVVVTFTDPAHLAAYRDHLNLPFPIVADTDRALYGALGIERGTHRQVWSIGTLRMYAQLLRKGRRTRRVDADVRQLGADVVVDAHGQILKVFRPPSPDTRPTVDELLAALTS